MRVLELWERALIRRARGGKVTVSRYQGTDRERRTAYSQARIVTLRALGVCIVAGCWADAAAPGRQHCCRHAGLASLWCREHRRRYGRGGRKKPLDLAAE